MLALLSGALNTLGNLSNIAWGAEFAKKGLDAVLSRKESRLPRVSADMVDALNRRLPSSRDPWTREQLFLFLAAFTRLEPSKSGPARVTWLRSHDQIIELVIRGLKLDPPEKIEITDGLRRAIEDVAGTVSLMPNIAVAEHQPIVTPSNNSTTSDDPSPATSRSRLFAGLNIPPSVISMASAATRAAGHATRSSVVAVQSFRDRRARRDMLRAIAACLELGGLSTLETRDVLMEQGLPAQEVDAALEIS